MIKKPELLAPAKDLEKLKWAIFYGADAVYIGGTNYSLRANANNFTMADMASGVKYAHEHNAKVYVTVNIVFHDEDTTNLKEYLKDLENIGVDAIIFSDPLIIDMAKKYAPKLDLHLSTQASVLNKDACKYYEKQGVKRIVLARECTKYDIKDIIENTTCEVECFIHGAMCTNLSGRCVLSNYFTNRDANRGGCCQVCRFNFNLYDSMGNAISNDSNFMIAPKDLSLAKHIKEMIELGISSFKLEGRMRSIYYVSTVVNVYRRLIDMYCNEKQDDAYINKAIKILYRCANRDVAAQFFNGKKGEQEQYYGGRKEDSNQDFLGVIKGYDNDRKELIIEQRNFFKKGDKALIFAPRMDDYEFIIGDIYDEDKNIIDAARHPKQLVRVHCDKKICINAIMCVNFFDWQNKKNIVLL